MIGFLAFFMLLHQVEWRLYSKKMERRSSGDSDRSTHGRMALLALFCFLLADLLRNPHQGRRICLKEMETCNDRGQGEGKGEIRDDSSHLPPIMDGIGFRLAFCCGTLGTPWMTLGSFINVGSSLAGCRLTTAR